MAGEDFRVRIRLGRVRERKGKALRVRIRLGRELWVEVL
jgi:hypothetical protein